MPTSQPPVAGALIDFRAGSIIFNEGDPGGDLFFIREGEVEVYKEKDGVEVGLAVLKPGEILGIMTCLTREPRLASARARTDVKAHIVKQAGIKALITSTPSWVNTVIKDFVLRIKNMDQLYWQAMARLDREDRDTSQVSLAAAVASGLAEVGALVSPPGDEPRLVEVDVVMQHLERILGAPRARLDAIFDAFVESGLLKAKDGAKARVAELAVLERLRAFADFARGYLASPDARMRWEELEAKHCQCLVASVEKARLVGHKPAEECCLPFATIQSAALSPELVRETFARAVALGVARVEGADDERAAVFVPAQLGLSVRSMVAIQKLRIAERKAKEAGARAAVQIITENF